MKSYSFGIFLLILCLGCATNKSVVETEKEKKYAQLVDNKVSNKEWKVYVQTANPLANHEIARIGLLPAGSTANRILLNGGDYIILKGDEVELDLPYYGRQQIGGGFTYGMSGFRFKGKVLDYKETFEENKKRHVIRIKTKHNQETFTIIVKFFRNAKSDVYINTSHRTALNYEGQLALE